MPAVAEAPAPATTATAPKGIMCCGSLRTSPFCPECGTKLHEPSPLIMLAGQIRRRIAGYREKMANPKPKKGADTLTEDEKAKIVDNAASKIRTLTAQYEALAEHISLPTLADAVDDDDDDDSDADDI